MAWAIEFGPNARRGLAELDRTVPRRLLQYLEERVIAIGDPRPIGKPVHGDRAIFGPIAQAIAGSSA